MAAESTRWAEPTLLVVLGDFGREAAIRFCARFAEAERAAIAAQLPGDAPFFDEYRRATLALVGDLPFAKAPALAAARAGAGLLDERVLVGFPGGLSLADVIPRLGALALEAMAGPLQRDIRQVMVLLPCNTLAPASWQLEERFADPARLHAMLQEAGLDPSAALLSTIERLGAGVELSFPTVPEAVVRHAAHSGASTLLPLGTTDIAALYADACRRLGSPLEVAELREAWHQVALDAIGASIEGGARRQRAHQALEQLALQARDAYGADLAIVEACTDLDYGVGLDSNGLYAAHAVEQIYRASDGPGGAQR